MKYIVASCLLSLTIPAAAHHGRDFLMVQDYSVPAPFTGIVYSNFELASHDGPDEWSIEPGIMTGLGAGFAFGAAARFSDEGEGWEYASVSPQIQYQLTPQTSAIPVKFALVAGYQFARGSNEEEAHTDPVFCGPEYGPDAPPCDAVVPHEHGHSHSHTGIHQHSTDAFFARLVMEMDLTPSDKIVANLIHVTPDGASAAWGYAIGLRHSFSHAFAIGMEAVGDFNTHGYQEAALACYLSPSHHFTVKLGAGLGLSEASPDYTIHTGVVWRF